MIRRSEFSSAIVTLLLVACGGGASPEPASPADPPLDDEPAAAAPASSPKVTEARSAIEAGDFAKAKELLEQATKEAPRDPAAAYYLGLALDSLGESGPAVAEYRRALELDPALAEAAINLSGLLLDGGDAAGALAVADAGLAKAKGNPPLLRNRAVALDALGKKEALAAFRAASEASPDDAEVRVLEADALARAGDREGAVRAAARLLGSNDVPVLATAARLLGKLGAYDDCVKALDRALGKQPVAELLVQRGLCRHGKKDDAGARADYEAAVAKDPAFAPARYYLGRHLLDAGDAKAGKAALTKAVELDRGGKIGAAAQKALDGAR
ncbi:MAG: tetratricopeptide repeat protein [Deltaproteobacteria bacterium]|nr:tetratricopeptide repeat protein [Deltaproteobacteria bacterium]